MISSLQLVILWTYAVISAVSTKAVPDSQSPVVAISQGSLRGISATTPDNTTYYQFLGIPYAKPPIGALRFKAPQAPESWHGVRNASSFRTECKQRGTVSGEDCLFLNVFTPKLPARGNDTLLPVMVRIHGGAFVKGSGDVNPGHLLDLGVVVVTVNYRLGVFGFVSLEGTDAGGNAGLKDQAAALRWVKANIAKFGGDPDKVTIFGQSAGSASVHFQVLSPTTAGLFRAAISESGSAMDPWAFRENNDVLTERMGHRLGLNWTTNQQLLDGLRTKISADQLLDVSTYILTANESSIYISEGFVPSLDHLVKGESLFLTDLPRNMEKKGVFNKVAYMAGTNKLEAGSFVGSSEAMKNSSYWSRVIALLEHIVPAELGLQRGSAASKAVASRIKDFYFPNQTMSYETRQQWIDLQTDYQFVVGDQRRLYHRIQLGNPTYEYQFSYGRSVHGAEKPYVMCTSQTAGHPLCRLIGEMWSNFAKHLNPSTSDVRWQPVTNDSRQYMDFNSTGTLMRGMKEEKRMAFWKTVFGEMY